MRPVSFGQSRLAIVAGVLVAIATAACAGATGGGIRPGGGVLAADTGRPFIKSAKDAPPIAVLKNKDDEPSFPDGLRLAESEGNVLARFVVDSTGRIDNSTITIVRSTDPRLSQSVTAWLTNRRFVAARKDGRTIAARTEQDFHFGLDRLKVSPGSSGNTDRVMRPTSP